MMLFVKKVYKVNKSKTANRVPIHLSYSNISIYKYIVKYFPYPKVANPVPQSGQSRTPKWPIPYPKVANSVP